MRHPPHDVFCEKISYLLYCAQAFLEYMCPEPEPGVQAQLSGLSHYPRRIIQ